MEAGRRGSNFQSRVGRSESKASAALRRRASVEFGLPVVFPAQPASAHFFGAPRANLRRLWLRDAASEPLQHAPPPGLLAQARKAAPARAAVPDRSAGPEPPCVHRL